MTHKVRFATLVMYRPCGEEAVQQKWFEGENHGQRAVDFCLSFALGWNWFVCKPIMEVNDHA